MKKKLCISYLKIFGILMIAGLLNISKSLAQEIKYGNYADTLAEVPAFQRIAIEWVEKGKTMVPEADRAKFEQVAWSVIKDKNEMTKIGITAIAEENNCPQWKILLSMVGNGFLKDATKIIEETRTANEQGRKEIDQLTGEKERIAEENEQKAIGLEQAILGVKSRGSEWVQKNALQEIKSIVSTLSEQKYEWKQETVDWLKELGIQTEGLKVKDGK